MGKTISDQFVYSIQFLTFSQLLSKYLSKKIPLSFIFIFSTSFIMSKKFMEDINHPIQM